MKPSPDCAAVLGLCTNLELKSFSIPYGLCLAFCDLRKIIDNTLFTQTRMNAFFQDAIFMLASYRYLAIPGFKVVIDSTDLPIILPSPKKKTPSKIKIISGYRDDCRLLLCCYFISFGGLDICLYSAILGRVNPFLPSTLTLVL